MNFVTPLLSTTSTFAPGGVLLIDMGNVLSLTIVAQEERQRGSEIIEVINLERIRFIVAPVGKFWNSLAESATKIKLNSPGELIR